MDTESHRDFLREKRDLEKPGDEEEDFMEGEKAALVVELGRDLDDVVGAVVVEVRDDFLASRSTFICSSCFHSFSLLLSSSCTLWITR